MQSCPKNVLTGPLTGDSKRSNISAIAKDSMPLPPVALALPLEPASAMGPPSPARGSAGMPPPPSPAGATYQPPPPAPKQESLSPEAADCKPAEKKRKARVGKAMVRNNIAANFPENTMLLMCNPVQNSLIGDVKREIESPKEKESVQKKEVVSDDETKVIVPPEIPPAEMTTEQPEPTDRIEPPPIEQPKEEEKQVVEPVRSKTPEPPVREEILEPCVKTVAENVKVKNMKRKMSLTKEKEAVAEVPPVKKPKVEKYNGSYKDLIKKDTNVIKINNGKRKLIIPKETQSKLAKSMKAKQKQTTKRKLPANKDEPATKKAKVSKPLVASNLHNSKQNLKDCKDSGQSEAAMVENKDAVRKCNKKPLPKVASAEKKLAPALLDSLIAKNNVDRTIECVVSEGVLRTPPKQSSALKLSDKCLNKNSKVSLTSKKSTNSKQGQVKSKLVESQKQRPTAAARKKRTNSKSKELVPQAVSKIPRRSISTPRWSNGWTWQGEAYEAKVFLNSDETTVVRKCYPAMRHIEGDIIECRDCVLLKAGPRKNDLPFVAKIAALWENSDDGEMMMSLLWYYRPEHTEQGRLPTDQPDEVFASRHKDSNSVACIDDKCYVLTFNEYCRYRKDLRRLEEGLEPTSPCIPLSEPYPRSHRQPVHPLQVSPEMVFFCRRVYDFRQKRIVKNPS